MDHPAGESDDGALRIDFDRRLRLEFHGSRITSDAGLLSGARRGHNTRYLLAWVLRQSVFGGACFPLRRQPSTAQTSYARDPGDLLLLSQSEHRYPPLQNATSAGHPGNVGGNVISVSQTLHPAAFCQDQNL